MKRLESETQEDYKLRRKLNQSEIKNKLKPRWFWKSKVIFLDLVKQLEYLKYGNKDFQSNLLPHWQIRDNHPDLQR